MENKNNHYDKDENIGTWDFESTIDHTKSCCFTKIEKEYEDLVQIDDVKKINVIQSVIPDKICKYKSNKKNLRFNFLKLQFLKKERNFRKNSYNDNTISQICICSTTYDTSDEMIISSNGSVNFQNRIYKYDEFSFINNVLNMFIEISFVKENDKNKAKMSIKIENGEEKIFLLPYREEFKVKISAHSCLLEESYVYNTVIKKIQ